MKNDLELWCDYYESPVAGVYQKTNSHKVPVLSSFTGHVHDELLRLGEAASISVEHRMMTDFGDRLSREVYYLKYSIPPVDDSSGFSENWVVSAVSGIPRRKHLKGAPNFEGHNLGKVRPATMDQVKLIPECTYCVAWRISQQKDNDDAE